MNSFFHRTRRHHGKTCLCNCSLNLKKVGVVWYNYRNGSLKNCFAMVITAFIFAIFWKFLFCLSFYFKSNQCFSKLFSVLSFLPKLFASNRSFWSYIWKREYYLEGNSIKKRYPVDTGRKLNVHKTFGRRPGRLLNVLCTFNLRPVSMGYSQSQQSKHGWLTRSILWVSFYIPENIRGPLVFWYFQVVWKKTTGSCTVASWLVLSC